MEMVVTCAFVFHKMPFFFLVFCKKINLLDGCRKSVIETKKSFGIMGTMVVTEIDKLQPVIGKLNDLLRLLSPDVLTDKVRCTLALPILTLR